MCASLVAPADAKQKSQSKKVKLSAADALSAMGVETAIAGKVADGPATGEEASLKWPESPFVDEIDGRDPNMHAILKARTRFSMPLVMRGALKKRKDIMEWGNIKKIVKNEEKKLEAGKSFVFNDVKISNTPVIIYWKQAINWLKSEPDQSQ